jgi:hypothetical protein
MIVVVEGNKKLEFLNFWAFDNDWITKLAIFRSSSNQP